MKKLLSVSIFTLLSFCGFAQFPLETGELVVYNMIPSAPNSNPANIGNYGYKMFFKSFQTKDRSGAFPIYRTNNSDSLNSL